MSTQLGQIAKKAKLDRHARFTSLAHLLTPAFLKETWRMMNRKAASGVDGESTEQFASEMEERVEEICRQLKAGMYRAPPVRRVEIPKGPGKSGTRPLGIPTVADRLLQRAVARILEAVFEADFLDCSFGFRPGRNPHHALQALRRQVVTGRVSHVFEADIRSYFTQIDHQWLRRMVAHRIADPIILRLISKWLKAGALRDGVFIAAEEGTPQGGPISPVLSNVYLHFTLDLWFEKKFKSQCRGEAYLVQFADDFVGCFQFQEDAQNFQRQLRERFARFNLELAEDENSAAALWTFCCRHAGQTRAEAGDLRVSRLQACLWGGSKGALRLNSHPQHQKLQAVSRSHPPVVACAQALEEARTATLPHGDAARLLPVLCLAPLRT